MAPGPEVDRMLGATDLDAFLGARSVPFYRNRFTLVENELVLVLSC